MKETQYLSSGRLLFAMMIIVGLTCAQVLAEQYPKMTENGPNYDFTGPATKNFAAFIPPIDSNLTVNINAPQIAEWTRSNQPGDTMALTGEKLSSFTGSEEGRDTRFVIYGEGRPEIDGLIQRLDGQQCAITLSTNLPPDEMYLMWPHNDSGYGEPVRINGTELWWANDYVEKGGSFRVFGQNLTLGSTTSYLYIKELDRWLTNSLANPYMAQYTFPSDAEARTYTVYAHNGHGRKYGWSEPLMITVWDGPKWNSGTTYTVTEHGLDNTGVRDNSSALKALWSTAGVTDWPTLYFPAGEYVFSNTSTLQLGGGAGNGIRLLGDGTNTVISIEGEFTSAQPSIQFYGKNNLYFKDIAFDLKDITYLSTTLGLDIRYCNGVTFDGVLLDNRDLVNTHLTRGILNIYEGGDVLFTNCLIYISKQMDLNTQNVVFDSCTFRGVHDCGNFIGASVSQLAIIDSTADSLDTSNVYNRAGWWKGRWIVSGLNAGCASWYIGGNIGNNAQPRYYAGLSNADPGNGGEGMDWNAGETFMKEGGESKFRGVVESATSNSVTFSSSISGVDTWHGVTATIVSGTGLGQSRLVSKVDGNTLHLKSNWRIIPDSTSVITSGRTAYQWVFYDNQVYSDNSIFRSYGIENASAGVQFSSGGGGHSVIIDSNTFEGDRKGIVFDISASAAAVPGINTVSPHYFPLVQNNILRNIEYDFLDMTHNYPVTGNAFADDILLLGLVYRKNTSINTVKAVFGTFAANEDNEAVYLSVFDQNTATGFGSLDKSVYARYNDVWTGNTFNGDGNDVGLTLFADRTPALCGNTYNGFSSNYQGALPGGVLELPTRLLFNSNKLSGTFPVYNSGTAQATWNPTVIQGGEWLNVLPGVRTINAEETDGVLNFEIDPSEVPAKGQAIIEVTSGGQSKQITVVYEKSNQGSYITYALTGFSGKPLRAKKFDKDSVDILEIYEGLEKKNSLTIFVPNGLHLGLRFEEQDASGVWHDVPSTAIATKPQ